MLLKVIRTFFFLGLGIFMFLSFSNDPVQKKIIRTNNFDIYFYVTLKKKKTSDDKDYYWYKSGEIHHSFGDAGGELLHESYIKYYNGNQLAEKGTFNYGLKKGVWKQWHSNGSLKEESRWVDGVKYGPYLAYNQDGDLIKTGKYRNDIKEGIWVNFPSKDTTWYEKGSPFKENPRNIKKRQDSIDGKKSFFQKIFKKKDQATHNKDNFFNRLFKKKNNPSENK